MKTEQRLWTQDGGWSGPVQLNDAAQLIIAFGGVDVIHKPEVYQELRRDYPSASIISASTAGEISGNRVFDHSVVATAIQFEHTPIRIVSIDTREFSNSYDCGKEIQRQLNADGLNHILILSEGTQTNGDELVRGVNDALPEGVLVTGGLAADAGRFTRTYVGVDEVARPDRIAAVGFYGNSHRVGHGSQGGWDPFGPVRVVTKSEGNILYELDGENALELYKRYLGERSKELPGSALLFPLCIYQEKGTLVRTILSIDEASGSMRFAGDVPEGSTVQFMMANFDRLIDGASEAAVQNVRGLKEAVPSLVLMISCVGRKIVLDHRIEEEVEGVCDTFGADPVYCGFYSNGEISPARDAVSCSLHNQTMTITTYTEVPA